MASKVLVKLEEVATCPICLKLLTEPISLDCGHSFCQACITADNKEALVSQAEESDCPVGQIRYQPGNLRSNRHLASIVERLKELKTSVEKEEKENICVHHGEKLMLFCKLDGKSICWLYEWSQEHCGHPTFLTEEVAQEYQNQIQTKTQNIQEIFSQLRAILDSEEQKELQELRKQEEIVVQNLSDADNELAQQSSDVKNLMSDL